jgi:beta-lactam-binding protein with PASTA domain
MKTLKYILVFVVLFSLTHTVFAKYSGGNGTPSSPYIINSPGDLLALAADANDYTNYFRQTSNINLLGTTRTTALIAPDTDNATDGYQGTQFMGTYDGNGYQIQNFEINTQGGNQDFLGLFGFIGNNGVVKNVNLLNCNIVGGSSSDYCGGICGQNSNCSIINCQVSGSVSGRNYIGGLCGYNTATISGSYSTANASGYDTVGGLCGYSGGTITQSSSIGSATGHDNVGGLCGYQSGGTISICHASGQTSGGNNQIGGLVGYLYSGSITESYAAGPVFGVSNIGGFVGYVDSGGNISDSYALGDVQATGDNVGGFIGYFANGSISRAYAKGQVSGNNNVGGFLGNGYCGGWWCGISIYDSYSTGSAIGSSSVGGFCGTNNNCSINNCFWDKDTSLLTTSAGGTGKTTIQMKDIDTYLNAGWRISGDVLWYYWYMPVNDYPRLSWEPAIKVPDLSNMTHSQADALINQLGFSTGQVIYQYNKDLAPEIVVGQYPVAGLNRKPGEAIHIVVTANTPRHYSGGTGTVSNPFLIGGINDLLTLANNTSDYYKSFKLITDIDMADWCFNTAIIAPDTITAGDYQGTVFTGKFNGDGHRILNLTFYPDISGREYTGLFGNIGTLAQITNLSIENGYTDNRWTTNYHSFLCASNSGTITGCSATGLIKGGSNVGGICAYNAGTISQCDSDVDIQSQDTVGGLCGYSGGTITQSSSIGSATGHDNVGGLCGYQSGGTISICHASGQTSGGNNQIGGLVGYLYSGSITESYAAGPVFGVSNIGGFVGYVDSGGNISDSYALGDVQATGDNVGGFIGYFANGSISRAYAKGQVSGNNNVGGFLGNGYCGGWWCGISIYDSYSTGSAIGSSSVGGFCGTNNNCSINNCFWDKDTSLLTTSAGGTGKTTVQMKDINTYLNAGWRISGDVLWYYWYKPTTDYPRLSWEMNTQKVPNVIGLMQPEALTAITDANFTVGRILYQYNDQLPIGTVVNQYPTAGLNRAVYERIDIVVSTLSEPNYAGGLGTVESPFEIADVNDLLTLANNPNDVNQNFILVSDIDLGAWAFTTALISPSTSTTGGYQGTPFAGSFNGNQHVIRNMVLYPEVSGRGYQGLFGNIAAAGHVYDLGVENFKLDNRWSADYSGGLCGANYGTIQGCYTIGNMKCFNYTGGLCGYTSGTIEDCFSTITISGSSYVGGLCGQSQNSAVISNCHAVADITAGYCTGGLVGYVSSSSVSDSFANGSISGSDRVGGLAGYSDSSSSFSRCFADVDVTASGSYSGGFIGTADYTTTSQCYAYGDAAGINYTGGFAGHIAYGSISDSYATGWLLGNDYVGGFIGLNDYGTVSRCYSIGSVVGGATAVNVGGFSGAGNCAASFWDTDSSFRATSSCGTGRPTAQMVLMSTYSNAGWSISLSGTGTTWKTAANSTPWLSWETDINLVPNLVGKTQTDAEYEILNLGYAVGDVTGVFSDTIPVGQVISQYPPAGAITVSGASIDLVVSSGLADVPVPYVISMQQSQAEATIIYGKLQVCNVTYQASPTVPAGSVISQSPAAGTQAAQQSCVNLVVSNGSGGSVVPNLVALTQAQAQTVIAGEGFVLGNVIHQYSNVVSAGYVISNNPPAGTPAMPGQIIDIVISDGPQPVVMPNLVGVGEYSAIIQVFTNGLIVGIVTNQYDNSVPAGHVISHSPSAGQTVQAGSAVDLVISLGATPVSVPTVVGMTQSTAVSTLISAGLFIGQITEQYNDIVAQGLVFSQSPLQGSAVPAGTPVDLWISKGPHQITVPNVVGLALQTAVTVIENAELKEGSLVEQYSNGVAPGSIISQSPDPGTVVNSGSAVDLVISKGLAPCAKPDWSAPFGPNVMVIYARVKVNGIEIAEPNSMLGGFMGGVSAGYANVENKPTGIVYQLVVTSQSTSGQITFRIFNSLDCTVYAIADTMQFVPGTVVGSLLQPVWLEANKVELRTDINHDGKVDLLDFSIMAQEWLMTTN